MADWGYYPFPPGMAPSIIRAAQMNQQVLSATLDLLAYTMHPPRLLVSRNLRALAGFQLSRQMRGARRPFQRAYRLPPR